MEPIAKVRFKAGSIEVEYEGSASFLEGRLEAMVVAFMDIAKHAPTLPGAPDKSSSGKAAGALNGAELSTNTIASTLGCKTGSDLVIAAAAKLTLVDGKPKFTRKEITAEMKAATTFYKTTFLNNLSASLDTLVKDQRLHLQAANEYAVSATELKSLEAQLAR